MIQTSGHQSEPHPLGLGNILPPVSGMLACFSIAASTSVSLMCSCRAEPRVATSGVLGLSEVMAHYL